MNTREMIQKQMMQLQLQLNEIDAKEAAQKKIDSDKKEVQRKLDNDELIKQWNAAYSTCDIQLIKTLLPKIAVYQGCYEENNRSWCDYKDEQFRARCYQQIILRAIDHDNDELLKLVIENAKPPGDTNTQYYLDLPCDLPGAPRYDENICYPLIYAILKKSENCAALLINMGVNLDTFYCQTMHWCGAALNENRLRGTALTCAIENNLSKTAMLLIEKGAKVGRDYLKKISYWQYGSHGYTRKIHKTFDSSMTPFLLAAQHNNVDLLSYMLDNGANSHDMNTNQQTAIDLASDDAVKALLLSRYSYSERLQRINFEGDIPAEIRCTISGVIMHQPVSYIFKPDKNETIFCKNELIKLNQGKPFTGKMLGPHKKLISLEIYTALLALPLREDIALKAKQFVENAEKQAVQVTHSSYKR